MADRYWVGGSGTWNTTSTTNWSTISGGSGGASVPTAADNVFFDQAGTYTVTMTGALTCLDITVSAGTVTFATGTTPTLTISGSMSLIAGTVWNSTGAITFNATTTGKTVTTNGVSFNAAITFNGVGGYWTLGSALTSGGLTITAGTFDTSPIGNYTVTASTITTNFTSTRTINLNGSIVTINSSGTAFNATTNTGLTFNAGTSTINCTSASSVTIAGGAVNGAGLTFYNVRYTGALGGTTHAIQGTNTFNSISVTGPAAAGFIALGFTDGQTINDTLSTTGTAGNRRVWFRSSTYGIAQTLTINAATLTDADFRDIYVVGTAAPLTGTRIGNRGNNSGITFSTAKTVYWNLTGTQNWSANGWAATSGGTPSTDNFPLPQDTAKFDNTGAVTTVLLDSAIGYVGTVDMSARTSATPLGLSAAQTVYGNWTNGSGTSVSGNGYTITFSGGTQQTITSAGKTFLSTPFTIDSYGGTVQLADTLNISTSTLTVTNGTFSTQGYAVTASAISSSNSNVRAINLGASTVTLSASTTQLIFTTTTNLTFNAGTSSIAVTGSASGAGNLPLGGLTYYDFSIVSTSTSSYTLAITGANTFRNFTITNTTAPLRTLTFASNQIFTSALTCAGNSAVNRVFLSSDTLGTQRTINAAAISATDCDFRDIALTGAASGASPTRAGDCGGNSGITFPAAKTVYWNLTGTQNWSATGWAANSGGTPAVNNFPLAQDTAVFDNTGTAGTVTIDTTWNIGTVDFSARTTAMAFSAGTVTTNIYGNWLWGSGVTCSSTTGTLTFSKNGGIQTITSNGVQFDCNITLAGVATTVQLGDAISLTSVKTLTVSFGSLSTFDAVAYNVTTGTFSCTTAPTIKMGSGTWTISGIGTCWNISSTPSLIVSTSTIILSDTTTSSRIFAGGGRYYNKLTIGGATGISTTTITGTNTFGELASTKTVAHTIIFSSAATTTVGKWSITGISGNVVTISPSTAASPYTLSIAGPAVTGVDYLSISYCTVSSTSSGEFYTGANSTNTAGNTGPIFFTAAPTPRTLYWVGGTGNWSSTTKWDTVQGGAGGAAIPTSLDAVIFDSTSNATAYTATIDAAARCSSLNMAGPASGNITFAGTSTLSINGNTTFAATGITRTFTGAISLAGNSNYTLTTNGLAFANAITFKGIGSSWTLGSGINIGISTLAISYGSFSTSSNSYNITCGSISSSGSEARSLDLNASTVTLGSSGAMLSFNTITNLSFNAGTSQINITVAVPSVATSGLSLYNLAFTNTTSTGITIGNIGSLNNLSFIGRTTAGVTPVTFSSNLTINGTLTLAAGTNATIRTFLASDTIGTQRTLTVNALAAGAADYDFRDIAVTGTASPISGTRFGDCKGNSGITFDAAKTVYWNLASGGNWSATGWAATGGGTPALTNFPLAQDTATFQSTGLNSAATITVSANYNIGTIDMSDRTANTMTLATSTNTPFVYGNWINGTGTTLTGSGTMTFSGRGSQTITSAGKSFTQGITVNSLSGSVTLQDAFTCTSVSALTLTAGTFDANTFSCTVNSVTHSGSLAKTFAIGSGTWTLTGVGGWSLASAVNATITGTGIITLTSASSKTFSGNSLFYSGITLDQGGAGALTITGNNTFKNITNSYAATGATTIALGATTQTITGGFSAAGTSGKLLTISGTSAASPGTLIFTGSGSISSDYLLVQNVRAYPVTNTWYAGKNSTNNGSLGWYFIDAIGALRKRAAGFFMMLI